MFQSPAPMHHYAINKGMLLYKNIGIKYESTKQQNRLENVFGVSILITADCSHIYYKGMNHELLKFSAL